MALLVAVPFAYRVVVTFVGVGEAEVALLLGLAELDNVPAPAPCCKSSASQLDSKSASAAGGQLGPFEISQAELLASWVTRPSEG